MNDYREKRHRKKYFKLTDRIKSPLDLYGHLPFQIAVTSNLLQLSKDVVIRDIVELEEVYAKSAAVQKNDRNYRIINLPKFYFDMENYKERNAASDVKREIERLKEQGVEGLVIDRKKNPIRILSF